MNQENKRRNLVGEGFEDVIAAVISRLTTSEQLEIRNRSLLHDLPGFHAPPPGEKAKRVDLNRVQSDMRHFHFAFSFGDVLDLGETRFKILYFLIL